MGSRLSIQRLWLVIASILYSKSLSAQDKRDLFQLNYKKLLDTQTFQASIAQELPHLRQHANEALRLAVLKAKGNHFSTDLAIEGGLLASVGLIKILFGRLLTGDNQFTEEKELASQKDLNLLYKKEQGDKPKGLPHLASYLTIGSAMTLPFLFGKSLQKAMMSTNEKPPWIQKKLRQMAPHFDYNYSKMVPFLKNVPLIALPSLALIDFFLDVGEVTNARSIREKKKKPQ